MKNKILIGALIAAFLAVVLGVFIYFFNQANIMSSLEKTDDIDSTNSVVSNANTEHNGNEGNGRISANETATNRENEKSSTVGSDSFPENLSTMGEMNPADEGTESVIENRSTVLADNENQSLDYVYHHIVTHNYDNNDLSGIASDIPSEYMSDYNNLVVYIKAGNTWDACSDDAVYHDVQLDGVDVLMRTSSVSKYNVNYIADVEFFGQQVGAYHRGMYRISLDIVCDGEGKLLSLKKDFTELE